MDIKQTMNSKRLQFDFSLEALQSLDNLKEKTDASTRAEVVRNALKLYDWFASQDSNCLIEVRNKNGEVLCIIPLKILIPSIV